jgi:hypothetical protein
MIERIVQTLMQIQTRWTLDEVLEHFPALGPKLVKSAGKRRTFQDSDNRRYSFYFCGDNSINFIEANFDTISDTDQIADSLYNEILDEFWRNFDNALCIVLTILGNGIDYSLNSSGDLPHERDSIRLVLWELQGADLMLELKHEAREVPIRLVLTLVPVTR